MAVLYKNNKDYFDVDFLRPHPLEYLIEEKLGGKCIVYHGNMNKFGCSETYVNFSHDHNYKKPMIYQAQLNDWRERGWYEI